MMPLSRLAGSVVVLAAWMLPGIALGQSKGLWHIPSTMGQFFGYGYGPGHHAPIVRTPGNRPRPLHGLPRRIVAPVGGEGWSTGPLLPSSAATPTHVAPISTSEPAIAVPEAEAPSAPQESPHSAPWPTPNSVTAPPMPGPGVLPPPIQP